MEINKHTDALKKEQLEIKTKVLSLSITSQQRSIDIDRIEDTLTGLFRRLDDFKKTIIPQDTQLGKLEKQVKRIESEVKQMTNTSPLYRIQLLEQNNVLVINIIGGIKS